MRIWSVLYAPIVVGYLECVIYPYCSWVFGVCYKVVGYIEYDIKKELVYGVGACVCAGKPYYLLLPSENQALGLRNCLASALNTKEPVVKNSLYFIGAYFISIFIRIIFSIFYCSFRRFSN